MKQTLVSNPFLSLLKVEIKKFNNEIDGFCSSKNIEPSISNYLSFKDERAFLPKNINKILGMKFPKYYLATHNDFWNFIYSLPSDFRSDVIMFLNLKKTKNFLLDNLETVDYLKSLHKEKYHNLLKRRK